MIPRRGPLWRRWADYRRATLIAIVGAIATNITQCAWTAGADAAKDRYWKEWSRGAISTMEKVQR